MPKTPSVDTNVLLRAMLADIPAQTEIARALLTKFEVVEIADLALTEMVFVLENVLGLKRPAIGELLESLIANQHVKCNKILIEKALPWYLHSPGCSFNDCCLAAYADLNDTIPLYTFDKKLARQLEPAQLLK